MGGDAEGAEARSGGDPGGQVGERSVEGGPADGGDGGADGQAGGHVAGVVVFLGRFRSVLRTYAAFLAGTNRMRWRRFLLFNTAGGDHLGRDLHLRLLRGGQRPSQRLEYHQPRPRRRRRDRHRRRLHHRAPPRRQAHRQSRSRLPRTARPRLTSAQTGSVTQRQVLGRGARSTSMSAAASCGGFGVPRSRWRGLQRWILANLATGPSARRDSGEQHQSHPVTTRNARRLRSSPRPEASQPPTQTRRSR